MTPKKGKRPIKAIAPIRQKLNKRFLAFALLMLTFSFFLWLTLNAIALQSAAKKPVDAILVLGGSIRREIYVAELAKQYPQTPILISKGSPDPCIWLIFQRSQTSMQQVLLEKCAKSTFDNFYYTLPILRRWQVHKLKIITSPTHLPRAKWLAQIILGSHKIWVDVEAVQEKGIPGNRETSLKTAIDITRSLIFAVISQFFQPHCQNTIHLASVDIENWRRQGFACEHQAQLKDSNYPNPK